MLLQVYAQLEISGGHPDARKCTEQSAGSFDFAGEMWEVMSCLIHTRRVILARLDPEFKRTDNPTYR